MRYFVFSMIGLIWVLVILNNTGGLRWLIETFG